MELNNYLAERKKYIDKVLDEILLDSNIEPGVIHEAMRYSVFAGGKRLRPILCLAACEAVGGSLEAVSKVACALELIHTYSLIHDDLPAMDNDDLRRGKPTNHIIYGEANAILAGDALLTYAFQIISQQGLDFANKVALLQVSKEIAEASGTLGMIGGQVVDIISEGQTIDIKTLEYIHNHKTGALIKASVRAGAILGGGTDEEVDNLTTYATNLGLAFQITDDLLDIIGDETKLGKPIGSDDKNEKATFPGLFGIEKSQQMAREAIDKAVNSLNCFGKKAEPLRLLAIYLLNREN